MPENLIDGSVYATTAEVMTSTKIEDPVYFGANTLVCGGSKIGRFTILNREVSVYTTEIGRFCSIGEKTVIGANQHPIEYLSTHPFHSSNIHFGFLPEYKNIERIPFDDWAAPTEIGSDVWIGTHVVINTGISVGHGAVLGAGAIVTKDIPPYAIAVGSPARILRYRFSEDIIAALLELKWWELDLSLIRSLTFDDIRTCIDELRHIRAQHPVS